MKKIEESCVLGHMLTLATIMWMVSPAVEPSGAITSKIRFSCSIENFCPAEIPSCWAKKEDGDSLNCTAQEIQEHH